MEAVFSPSLFFLPMQQAKKTQVEKAKGIMISSIEGHNGMIMMNAIATGGGVITTKEESRGSL